MISNSQAKKLGMNRTIDLRYSNAVNYIDKKQTASFKQKIINFLTITCFWFGVLTLSFIMYLAFAGIFKADANINNKFINRFPLENTIIGCYNSITKTTREDTFCNIQGDHNIILPAREQIKEWLKYYNEAQIVNRLALVNFESAFRENVGNPSAYGYVQTLRSHKIAPDINSQLAWLKNRENKTYGQEYFNGKSGLLKGCGYYWENENTRDGTGKGEYGVLSCMYRFHYDAINGTWYGIRGVTTTKFYKSYMYGIK